MLIRFIVHHEIKDGSFWDREGLTEVQVGGHTRDYFESNEMIPAFLQWLRDIDKETRERLLKALEAEFLQKD